MQLRKILLFRSFANRKCGSLLHVYQIDRKLYEFDLFSFLPCQVRQKK